MSFHVLRRSCHLSTDVHSRSSCLRLCVCLPSSIRHHRRLPAIVSHLRQVSRVARAKLMGVQHGRPGVPEAGRVGQVGRRAAMLEASMEQQMVVLAAQVGVLGKVLMLPTSALMETPEGLVRKWH